MLDFWLDLGVDGLRLDAVPYLYEREGTNCENLPETHAFLRELRAHVDANYPDRMLLAEANQWPEDAVAYFGNGDECHMSFHFPLMPRLFMAMRMEDRFPIIDILEQTPAIPDNAQWALFLRNHDELTLEMVTDEERDYMYRVYARDPQARINLGIRRRLAPLLGNNRRAIELINAILMSLEGTPVIYYGDEIGMGDNIYLGDRNGVRTPMQWSTDKNAGFSRAESSQLYLPVVLDTEYHYSAVNVEAQHGNATQLLNWMRRIIALRRRSPALSHGTISVISTDNRKVLAFVREAEGQRVLCVFNLAPFAQGVNLEIQGYAGTAPIELFGQSEFPAVSDRPYFLSLGPHSFYWFELRAAVVAKGAALAPAQLRSLPTADWEELVEGRARPALEAILGTYLRERRWFSGKAKVIRRTTIEDHIRIGRTSETMLLVLCVEYLEGEPEHWALFVTQARGAEAASLAESAPWSVVAALEEGDQPVRLVDALALPRVDSELLALFRGGRRFAGDHHTLTVHPFERVEAAQSTAESAPPSVLDGQQSNTSIRYPAGVMLKVVRRLESGVHPQVELGRILGSSKFKSHIPQLLGSMELSINGDGQQPPATIAILEQLVPHQSDAWLYALDSLGVFLEETAFEGGPPPATVSATVADLLKAEVPPVFLERATAWAAIVRTLGWRTAELHQALASAHGQPAFALERFTPPARQAWAHARFAAALARRFGCCGRPFRGWGRRFGRRLISSSRKRRLSCDSLQRSRDGRSPGRGCGRTATTISARCWSAVTML